MTQPEHDHDHEHGGEQDPNADPNAEANRPDLQDIIDTVIEELKERDAQIVHAQDQRMYFKAQAKKLQRRAEVAEAALASMRLAAETPASGPNGKTPGRAIVEPVE